MLYIRRRLQGVGLIFAFVYFYGLVLGALYLLQAWAFGKLPHWPWWQFALAPFALGAVAIAVEWLVGLLPKRSPSWHSSIPQWKKALFLVFLVLAVVGFILLSSMWSCGSC